MSFVTIDGERREVRIDLSPAAEPELHDHLRLARWLAERAQRPLHERMQGATLLRSR